MHPTQTSLTLGYRTGGLVSPARAVFMLKRQRAYLQVSLSFAEAWADPSYHIGKG